VVEGAVTGVGGLFASNRDPVESRHRIGVSDFWKGRSAPPFDLDRSKGKNAQIASVGLEDRRAPEHPPHDSGALWTIVGDVSHLAGIR
jgi:hypothetical protein